MNSNKCKWEQAAKELSQQYKSGYLDHVISSLSNLTPLEAAFIGAYIAADLSECSFLSPANFLDEISGENNE